MQFLKPIIGVLIAYLLIKIGVPFLGSLHHPGTWPVVPTAVMKMYLTFIIAGAFVACTFDEEGYNALITPVVDLYSNPAKAKLRLCAVTAVSLLGCWIAYQYVKPTFDAPVELRSVHPAPPSSVTMWNKSYPLQTLKNPFRAPDKAQLAKFTEEGGVIYYQNCFYCHGDKQDGKGHFAQAFNPMPANFVDVGTIAMLTESFVFWRVGSGGPGLPSEGTPWASAMPVWNTMLSEEEVWKAILFIYDQSGVQPRVTDVVAEKK